MASSPTPKHGALIFVQYVGYRGFQLNSATEMTSSPTPKHGAKITYEDALAYTRLVEGTFRGPKYEEFVEILDEFGAKRITLDGLVTRMKVLFKGHEELILGLITFLPPGCELKLKVEKRGWPTTQGSLHFLNKIKDRFDEEKDVYKKFLDAIKVYKKNPSKSLRELYKEVAVLFKGHEDLLQEFTNYLPDTLAASRDDVPRMSMSTAAAVKVGRTGVDGDDDLPTESKEGVTVGQYNLRWFPGRRRPSDPPFHPSCGLPCLSTPQSTAAVADSDDSDDDFSIYNTVKRVAVGRHQLRRLLPGRRQSGPSFPPSYNLRSCSDGAHYMLDTQTAPRDHVPCISTSQSMPTGRTDSDDDGDDLSTESVEGVAVRRRYQLRRQSGPSFPPPYNLRSCSDGAHNNTLNTLAVSRDDVPCISTSQSMPTGRTDSDDDGEDLSTESVDGVAVGPYQLRWLPGRRSDPSFPLSYNLRSRSDGAHYTLDTPAASRDDVPCLSTSQSTPTGRTDSDDSDDDSSIESVEGVAVRRRYQLRRQSGPSFPPSYNLRSRSDGAHNNTLNTMAVSRDNVTRLFTSQSTATGGDDSDDDLSIESVEGVAVRRRYQLRRLPGRQSGPSFSPSYNLRSCSDGAHSNTLNTPAVSQDNVPRLSTSQSTPTGSDDSDDDLSIESVEGVAVRRRYQLRRQSGPSFPPPYNLRSCSDGAHNNTLNTPAVSQDNVTRLFTSQSTATGGNDSDDDFST